MNARILRSSEWDRITSPGGPELLRYCEPQNADVVVVESDAGEILAHVFALRVTHFEGLWIKPEERGNAGVFRALKREAYSIPNSRDERWVFGGAETGNEVMAELCSRLKGQSMPVQFYAMPVGG